MVTPHINSPFLFGQRHLQQLFEGGDLCFALDGDLLAIPADALEDPTLLASLVVDGAAKAAGHQISHELASVYWHNALQSELETSGWLRTSIRPGDEARHRLPPLLESALLVHVLGLESPQLVPAMAVAVDHLLMHSLAPVAVRSEAHQRGCHEPMASSLVNALARTLRPWSFAAAPLALEERVLLLFVLADLATSKARKLLHEEKKHAHHHAAPDQLRRAVNQALRRWQQHSVSLTPQQRVVRAAAAFRYLNQRRRQGTPSPLDIEVVADIQRVAPRY